MLAILIVIFIFIIVLEVPALLRAKQYKAVGVFAFLYLLGVYMALAQFYGWPIFNPLTSLKPVLGGVAHAIPILAGWI